ncbi:MAG: phosphoribosylformylglycinamidine synthase subunit PurL [Bacteroidetes bacterium]|nr:phosphoribosylformylglycinamidine synthase subunit PurL [Bacteroidota bacterium]
MTNLEYKEPIVSENLAISLGLTSEEYKRILDILKRVPTYTELGVFSVMWSEHCSYKNSILEIKKLPRSSEKMLVEAGEENAGLIDIGNNLAVAFKIESHNHPSAVEPYQGAATAVGGILRDIFTMGARPIAVLNSLRFGNLKNNKTKNYLKNIVKGIGDYGNCFGVPNIGGEIYFHECYEDNPLVNAMAVGIVDHNKIAKSSIKGVGRSVMIVGSSTGKDGIQGASFASEDLSEKSESKRPSVQVGDPFIEKLLLEATLEVINEDLIDSIQDMGAAGITCSTSEMSAKGNVGMEIDLDLVPQREMFMTPFEIMLSESQERMLLVAKPGCEERIEKIFNKWDLHGVIIGKTTDTKNLVVKYKRNIIVNIPADCLALGGGAPVYEREVKIPEYIKNPKRELFDFIKPDNYVNEILNILSSPNISSKKWIYRQYDSMVRTSTVELENIDCGIVEIPGSTKFLALTTDCNSTYIYLNPKVGGMIAIAEAARNIVCSGGTPLGITNCLNFGNPYNPEVYWQFTEALKGISEACLAFNTPVTGGNVSFYNQSQNNAIYPTPVIGMVGIINSKDEIIPNKFQNKNDLIYLLGNFSTDLNGSVYYKLKTYSEGINAPEFNLTDEVLLHTAISELNKSKIITSTHDISEGGLIVTLLEMSFNKQNLGFKIDFKTEDRLDKVLFSESQSRVVVSIKQSNKIQFEDLCKKLNQPCHILGSVEKDSIDLNGEVIENINLFRSVYDKSFENKLNN